MNRPPAAAIALPLLASALALASCHRGEGDDARGARDRPGATVETAVAATTLEPRLRTVIGTIEPWSRVSPGTKLLGRVETVRVRVGDRVSRGAVLARLDERDLRAAVRQAEAAVTMAEAELEKAEAHHARILDLHARGSVTDKNLEDATAAQRLAAASVQQARANLAAAEVNLDYAVVRSPLAGWVTARHVEAGDMAAPGRAMFTLEDLSRVKVVLEVAESDVVGLAREDPVRIAVDVLQHEWQASIRRINPAGDPASRTYRVELTLDNPDGALKSGMFARAWLPAGEREALRVPRQAVVTRGQLEGLFVVESDGIARLRWVRLGRELDSRVEVLSGLRPGERYLPSPPPGFLDGTRLEER